MLHFPILTFWKEEDLYKLQVEMVSRFLRCDTPFAVETSIEFAGFLHDLGLDSDNYPLFLEILRDENHHVVDALLGKENAFELFTRVQPNYYILDFCFHLLYKHPPGGLYSRTLEIIFGILFRNYHNAKAGYGLYPLTLENVNSIGKFLDKTKDQSDPINRFILDILADIAEFRSINNEDPNVDKLSSHAVAIRNAFFDRRKTLGSVMPEEILVRTDYREKTVTPRKQIKLKDT